MHATDPPSQDTWRLASIRSAGLDGPGLDPDLRAAVLLTGTALGAARTWVSVLGLDGATFKAATWTPERAQGASPLTEAVHRQGVALHKHGAELRGDLWEAAFLGVNAVAWYGVPIRTAEGLVVAALQAAWVEPPNADPHGLLSVGAHLIAHELDSRRDRQDLAEALEGRRLAAAELDSFFSLSSDLLAVTDTAGTLRRSNRAWSDTLGHTRLELETMTLLELLSDDDREAVEAALVSGESGSVEARARRTDGTWRDLHIGVAVLPGAGTRFLVARDITHRNELARLKAAFISTVTHELRSPMMSVQGGLAILVRGMGDSDLSPRARELVELAERSAARLVRFANDVLDVSRMEAGRLPVAPKPVALDAIFDEAAPSLELAAVSRGVELLLVREPEAWVRADVVRAGQVLINLAGNAIKFSPRDATVQVSCAPEGEMWRLSVSDQGPGICDADLEAVFAPFAQLPGQPGRGGAGLGLHIAQQLIDAHGGEIGVESEVGVGSTFWFTLPRETPR
jgi:PAS domain S-box-containing protein